MRSPIVWGRSTTERQATAWTFEPTNAGVCLQCLLYNGLGGAVCTIMGLLIFSAHPWLQWPGGLLAAGGMLAVGSLLIAPLPLLWDWDSRAILRAYVLESGQVRFVAKWGTVDVDPREVRRIVRMLAIFDDKPAQAPAAQEATQSGPLPAADVVRYREHRGVGVNRYWIEHTGETLEIRRGLKQADSLMDWLVQQNPLIIRHVEPVYLGQPVVLYG